MWIVRIGINRSVGATRFKRIVFLEDRRPIKRLHDDVARSYVDVVRHATPIVDVGRQKTQYPIRYVVVGVQEQLQLVARDVQVRLVEFIRYVPARMRTRRGDGVVRAMASVCVSCGRIDARRRGDGADARASRRDASARDAARAIRRRGDGVPVRVRRGSSSRSTSTRRRPAQGPELASLLTTRVEEAQSE